LVSVCLELPDVTAVLGVVGPIVVGLVYIALASLFPEPTRQKVNAVVLAGAGAVYISGGSLAHSSYGCAICDPVIAIWLFLGAPSVWTRSTWTGRRNVHRAGAVG
jgi:drug/metabolite transporter (DMT)-like permease